MLALLALELALALGLELVHALALGLKHLLQRTSLCVCIPHTWGEHMHLFLLVAAAAEAIEVGAAPRSPSSLISLSRMLFGMLGMLLSML